MNTVTFELKIRPEDKNLFLEWNEEHEGPHFILEETSAGYFQDDKGFAEYYKKDWDEVVLMTVISITAECALNNHLEEAANSLAIEMKYLEFYQDPGTGEVSGNWVKYERKEE